MSKSKISDEWFEFARRDLESARFLIRMDPFPIEIICYHCEQSAEKYLKGFLILNGKKVEKTHDIVLLNNRCIKLNDKFKEIYDDCIELISYGVQVRYPYQLDVDENDMLNAIESAERIEKFILSLIEENNIV
ncbi:HEPN domain-containing protein [Clostridium sp.]|uniref:HEPN domain-containing protein n=1 Tax=Clostridium sp. TaxID=1506 RepID=UPI002FC8DA29